MEIDMDALRQALLDYYGTSGSPLTSAMLAQVEQAGPKELIAMAQGLDWL